MLAQATSSPSEENFARRLQALELAVEHRGVGEAHGPGHLRGRGRYVGRRVVHGRLVQPGPVGVEDCGEAKCPTIVRPPVEGS